jgi:hypothetical protein
VPCGGPSLPPFPYQVRAWSSWGGSQRLACSRLRLYKALVVFASAAFSHQMRAWSNSGGSHWLASCAPRLYVARAAAWTI